MATDESSMTREYHFVVQNLASCTRAVDLIGVFRKYGVEHVEVKQSASGENRAFLSFVTLDSAELALNATASGIYVHSKRLELECTSYYLESKMAITPPVAADYENRSICSILPIEIISKIIGYLPYEDQAKLERVSKLWRLASLCSHSEMKHFEIDSRWPSGWRGLELTHRCFYWLMNRSKRYVRSLSVSNYAVLNDMSRLLTVAVRSCPYLHEVNFRETVFSVEMAKDLCFIAPRLTAITIGRSKGPIEPLLTVIFKVATKFVTLKLIRTIITGESFAYLNTDLESLTVEHCHYIESPYMCKAIERFQCLKYLEISTCMQMDDSILRALIRNTSISKTIETLKLSYCPIPIPNFNGEQMLPQFEHHEFYIECKPGPFLLGVSLVKKYTNIKHLTLKFCGWVTEEVVSEIAKNLTKLEHLDLSGCTNIIGVSALNPLSKLTNITTINLNHLRPAIDGSVLKELKKLKQISCRNSLGFNDTAICEAIKNCPYLSKIIIEDCPNVGEPVIQCALSIIRNNDRTLPLIIYVNGSGITESMEFTQNEILEICDDRLYFPAYEVLLPGQGRRPFFCYMS